MRSLREPGLGRALVACVALLAVSLGLAACASPFDRDQASEPRPRVERSQALAKRAVPLPASPPTTTATDGAATTRPASTGAGQSGDAAPQGTTTPKPFRNLVTSGDATGDAGIEAPSYADLVSIAIETRSDVARVTLDVAGELPRQTPADEVMGFGVDIFRGTGQESDFQLFAEGGPDGWFAHLQTPSGFVRYPGAFAVGGTRLMFEVPWSAIGGNPPMSVSVFGDWSRKRVAVNASAEDALPDRGRINVPA